MPWQVGGYATDGEKPFDQGSFGTVWRARRLSDDARVALKLVLLTDAADSRERIAAERHGAMLQQRFQQVHGMVPTVYDFGHDPDGHLYIAMELIEGQPLGEKIAERGTGLATESVVHYGVARRVGARSTRHSRGRRGHVGGIRRRAAVSARAARHQAALPRLANRPLPGPPRPRHLHRRAWSGVARLARRRSHRPLALRAVCRPPSTLVSPGNSLRT